MAVLHGLSDKGTSYDFELMPLVPSLENPRDQYLVRVWRDEAIVFETVQNVHGSLLGHSSILKIACFFEYCDQIIEKSYSLDTGTSEYLTEHMVCLREDVNWLDVCVWGVKRGPRSLILSRVYIRTDMNEVGPVILIPIVSVRLTCELEAAQAFGKQLHSECTLARYKRIELEIQAPDDYGF
jgi:hypothetical protein